MHKGYRKKNERVACKRRRGGNLRGKKVRAHSCVRLPLEIVTFTLGIPRKNSSYLIHTKQRALWPHGSIFTHLNQCLTQRILTYVRYHYGQVYVPIASCYLNFTLSAGDRIFREWRFPTAPDPRNFSVPDLAPANSKFQNGRQDDRSASCPSNPCIDLLSKCSLFIYYNLQDVKASCVFS